MRPGLDATTLALYRSGVYDTHVRYRSANGSGTLVNLHGRLRGWDLTLPNPNSPGATLSVTLLREVPGNKSLSPMVRGSTMNRLDDGVTYSPFLLVGRAVRFEVALTEKGAARPADAATTWYEVFRGRISKVSWPRFAGHEVQVECRDLVGELQLVKSETAYEYAKGTAIETAIRQVLNNNGFTGVATATPVATAKVLQAKYGPGVQKSVWEQVDALAKSIGWLIWVRYGADGVPALTLWSPDRNKSVEDQTIDLVHDFNDIGFDEDILRNVGYVQYTNEAGIRKMSAPVANNDSIAKYGGIRRPFWISYGEDSPVRSEADAQAVLNAAVPDVSEPDVVATATVQPLPFAEPAFDLYKFNKDERFFDEAQWLAPFTVSVSQQVDGEPTSSIGLRGKPSAGFRTWRRQPNTPGQALRYVQTTARMTAATGNTYTVRVDADPSVAQVALGELVNGTTLVSGPAVGTYSPSGTEWVFNRAAEGGPTGGAWFTGVAEGYVTDADFIAVPEQGRDTVALTMRAEVLTSSDTQVVVRVRVADPYPGTAVTVGYTSTNVGGVTPASGGSIAAAAVTADLNTTGYIDYTITRPAFKTGTGRVTFTGVTGGRVPDTDAVDVPAQEKATFGPTLTVTPTPGDTSYSIAWAGDAVLLSIGGGAYGTPPASPISVARNDPGGADKTYSFRATKDEQTVTDTVVVPAQSGTTKTPQPPVVTVDVPTVDRISETVRFTASLGAHATGTLQYRTRQYLAYALPPVWGAYVNYTGAVSTVVDRDPLTVVHFEIEVTDGTRTSTRVKEVEARLPGFGTGGRVDPEVPMESGFRPFGRGHHGLDDVNDSPGYRRLGTGYTDTSHRLINVYRGAGDEAVTNLFRMDVDTTNRVGFTSQRAFIAGAYINSGFEPHSILRGTVREGATNLFHRTIDTLDQVQEGTTYKRTTGNEKIGAGRGFGALDANNYLTSGAVNTALIGGARAGLVGYASTSGNMAEDFDRIPDGDFGLADIVGGGAGLSGGNVLRTRRTNWGYYSPNRIPYDPSRLYRMRVRVRVTDDPGWIDNFGNDTQTADKSANYTSGGDAVATWAFDATAKVLTGTGGTQALYLLNSYKAADVSVAVSTNEAGDGGVVARYQDNGNYYLMCIRDDASFDTQNLELYKRVAGTFTSLGFVNIGMPRGTYGQAKLEIIGSTLQMYWNGAKVGGPVTDTSITAAGQVGLRNHGAGTFRINRWEVQTFGEAAVRVVTPQLYAGFRAFDANGNVLLNRYFAATVDYPRPSHGWLEFTGYLQGNGAAKNNANDPASPSGMGHTGVRFVSLLLLLNWPGRFNIANGSWDVDYQSLEVLDENITQRTAKAISAGGANINEIPWRRGGVDTLPTNMFRKGDSAADVTESGNRRFTQPDQLNPDGRVINVYRAGGNVAATSLFQRNLDTATDIIATAGRTFIDPLYVTAGLSPNALYRLGVGENADNLFKHGQSTSAQVALSSGRHFISDAFVNVSMQPHSILRGTTIEGAGMLFKRGADTAADILENGSRRFVYPDALNADGRVTHVARGADLVESVTNLFKNNDPADRISATSGRTFIDPLYVTAGLSPNALYRLGVGENADNLFKHGQSTTAQVGLSAGRHFISNDFVNVSMQPHSILRGGGIESAGNLFRRDLDTLANVADGGGWRRTTTAEADQATKPTQNLLGPLAPIEHTRSDSGFLPVSGPFLDRVRIDRLGLAPGDQISASAETKVGDASHSVDLSLLAYDAAGANIANVALIRASHLNAYRRNVLHGYTLPAGTVTITITSYLNGNATLAVGGVVRAMVNKGPLALPFEEPPLRPHRETQDHLGDGSSFRRVGGAFTDPSNRLVNVYRAATVEAVDNFIRQNLDAVADNQLSGNVVLFNRAGTHSERIVSLRNLGTAAFGHGNAQFEATSNDGSAVGIGFHRAGHSAVNLRHSAAGLLDLYDHNGAWSALRAGAFKVQGNTGLVFDTWGGGWFMSDGTWMRTVNSKNIWSGSGTIGNNGSLTLGDNGNFRAGFRLHSRGRGQICSQAANASATEGSALEIRERNFEGPLLDRWEDAPRLGFHWGGRVASQIAMPPNGNLYFLNQAATGTVGLYAGNYVAEGQFIAQGQFGCILGGTQVANCRIRAGEIHADAGFYALDARHARVDAQGDREVRLSVGGNIKVAARSSGVQLYGRVSNEHDHTFGANIVTSTVPTSTDPATVGTLWIVV